MVASDNRSRFPVPCEVTGVCLGMMKVADPADDPERTLQHKDDAAVLRRSVAQLSPTQAEVIDLVYYHGKTVGEAAEVLEIPEATVKTRMFYARKKLRELVEVGGLKSLH
jgi:RNA polymerase sigma-70 factor (ECF subfamily)